MRWSLPADTPGRLALFARVACAATAAVVALHPAHGAARVAVHAVLYLLCGLGLTAAAWSAVDRANVAQRPLFVGFVAVGLVVVGSTLLDLVLVTAGGARIASPPPGFWVATFGINAVLFVTLAASAGWRPTRLRSDLLADSLLLATAAAVLGVVLAGLWRAPDVTAQGPLLASLVQVLRAAPLALLILLAVVLSARGDRLGRRTSLGLSAGVTVFAIATSLLGHRGLLDAERASTATAIFAALVLLSFSFAVGPRPSARGEQSESHLRYSDAEYGMPPRQRATFVTVSALVIAGSVLHLGLRGEAYPALAIAAALFVLLLAARSVQAIQRQAAEAGLLERAMEAERVLSATLEQRVAERTAELAEAHRVLQRMWTLGQHVTLELNPQRVLERFMEAVLDIAHADAGALGLVVDEQRIRVAAAIGMGSGTPGRVVPVNGSAMGRVVRSGRSWATSDVRADADSIFAPDLLHATGEVVGLAAVPVQRRGERIGALLLLSRTPRTWSEVELARIESMTDMLSVALANADLVENLRQAEWRFRTLFRAAPDAVLTVLASGRVREANEAVRDVTGLDPVQLVGRVFADLAAPDERARLDEALRTALLGRPTRLEVRLARAGVGGVVSPGQEGHRLVAIAVSRLPEADPPTALMIARDITAEREMRARLAESERLAAIGELVAGVAHEVNNPLSTISAYAQLLLRGDAVTGDMRESLEVIRGETVRASMVVRDLLAFARRSEPQREAVDLAVLVERTVRLHAYHLASGRLRAELDLPADLPAVTGDPRQLQQVVLNLVTNAVQAMAPQGAGLLRIVARQEGAKVVLEVSDTGPGIAPEARPRIFEPFFTTKAEGEGTGLGLSVSYGIMAAHGGTLSLRDSSPSGSTFRLTLPAAAVADRVTSGGRPEGTLSARSPIAGIRLLFVDDEPALRRGVEQFGRLRGFTVLTAEHGAAGLELLRTTNVDAVVCDLRMPDIDGLAFHEILGRERPGLARRTVFVTGDVLGAPTRVGAAAHQPTLSKPFTFDRLEEAVAGLLRTGVAERSA